jgi:hypothetical protein
MDKLSKAQKDEYATAFSILALYDGGVSDSIVPNTFGLDLSRCF